MVLKDLSEPGNSQYDFQHSQSDGDPYWSGADKGSFGESSPNAFPYPTHIDLSKLPQVNIVYRMVFGDATQTKVARIHAAMHSAQRILKRHPTQEETDAVAYHTVKGIAIGSWALPVSLGGALWRWGRSMDNYSVGRIWRPKDLDFVNYWPSKTMPLARGQMAKFMWQSMRFGLHFAAWIIPISIFTSTYAETVMQVGLLKDPRMKDFIQAMKESAKEKHVSTADVLRQSREEQMKESMGELRGKPQGERQSQGGNDEAYGESSQALSSEYDSSSPVNSDLARSSNSGVLDDAQMRTQERRQPPPNRNTAGAVGRDTRSTDFDPFEINESADENNSPTAGNTPNATASSGGSAWDRIRANAGANSSSSPRGLTPPGMRRLPPQRPENRRQQDSRSAEADVRGESFSFSKGEEDRALAREQAQREFDQMLDKERMGEGGETSGGRRGGWRG